jgi:hypothetical protein
MFSCDEECLERLYGGVQLLLAPHVVIFAINRYSMLRWYAPLTRLSRRTPYQILGSAPALSHALSHLAGVRCIGEERQCEIRAYAMSQLLLLAIS